MPGIPVFLPPLIKVAFGFPCNQISQHRTSWAGEGRNSHTVHPQLSIHLLSRFKQMLALLEKKRKTKQKLTRAVLRKNKLFSVGEERADG